METHTGHFFHRYSSFQTGQAHTRPQLHHIQGHLPRLPHRRQDRPILHRLHRVTLDRNVRFFTIEITAETIRTTGNSHSTDPNRITYHHLIHFGPHAIRALTNSFNHSVNNNSTSNIWKVGKIISILKPNEAPINLPPTAKSSSSANYQKYLSGCFSTTITPTSLSLLHNTVLNPATVPARFSHI